MAETLTPPSLVGLRAQLLDMVLKDLLGPAGGEEEIVEEQFVRGRYILGMLAPKGKSALPDEDDELAVAGEDTEDGKAETPKPKVATMLPSSIGMTFTVAREATNIEITARHGRYERIPSDELGLNLNPPKPVWKRFPVEGTSALVSLKKGRIERWAVNPDYPEVYVEGLIREYEHEQIVTLSHQWAARAQGGERSNLGLSA